MTTGRINQVACRAARDAPIFQGRRARPAAPPTERRIRAKHARSDAPKQMGASPHARLAPNRAYFNLELEALDGNEERITEIKFDANRLRCYGGWAVGDSTTVAPTVRARAWLKLDAVLEDGPPPRLLLRVDGQLLYAMPLATRVRLRGVVLKGWANAYGRTNYARLAITDSVACAAARLVSLWLLRRANSDIALVVLAFAVPAPLLALLRANSTALRGTRRWSYYGDYISDRGGPLPALDSRGLLAFAYAGYGSPNPRWHPNVQGPLPHDQAGDVGRYGYVGQVAVQAPVFPGGFPGPESGSDSESDEESSASEESPVKAPRPSDNSELMNRFRSRLQASGSRSPPKRYASDSD